MMKKIFSLSNVTLLVALSLSGIAAWYSIIGLTAIFAAAVIPIIIMGSVLEVAKITATVWLRKYWHKASWVFKLYLIPAVVVLALLTSMGIFGFLSKAHIDQGVPSGDIASKVSLFDEKIKTERDNIKANREALSQMDAQVNNVMNKGDSEKSAERSVQIRRQQTVERGRLQKEIEASNIKITALNEQRAPIASDLRKVEAEVGPIKYIAALVYGDNPDQNVLERAVRWVIILLVIVFDPLAIALVLAANQSKEWDRLAEDDIAAMSIVPPKDEEIRPFTPAEIAALDRTPQEMEEPASISKYAHMDPAIYEPTIYEPEPGPFTKEHTDQINEIVNQLQEPAVDEGPNFEAIRGEDGNWVQTGPKFQEPIVETVILDQPKTNTITDEAEVATIEPFKNLEGGYVAFEGKLMSGHVLAATRPDLKKLIADGPRNPNISFGPTFPATAMTGDTFIRVDTIPNRAFKFNGSKWIEINRDLSDSYLTNNEYIQHLIDKLDTGEYDPELLTQPEQDAIAEYLKLLTKSS